jgi:RNA polymerase sigma factor (sigma-70 family)
MDGSPPDDFPLLRQYVDTNSPQAFATLVGRYADFVFATALRQTRCRDLAEDVTQAVFIVLARRARSLRKESSVAGFLHQTTVYAAKNALRARQRRRWHERRAAVGPAARTSSPEIEPAGSDEAVAVDRELSRLPSADRQLLLLHYFDGLTVPEAAQTLAISVEAARKRLHRALDRLRVRLAGAGVGVTTAALPAVLAQIAPDATSTAHSAAGAVTTIASQAVAGGADGNAFALAHSILQSMKLATLTKAACVAAATAVIGGGAALTIHHFAGPSVPAARTIHVSQQNAIAARGSTPPINLPRTPTIVDYPKVFTEMREAVAARADLERRRRDLEQLNAARILKAGQLRAARDALPKDSPAYIDADRLLREALAANDAENRAAQQLFQRDQVREMVTLFQKIEVAVTAVGATHGLSLPPAAQPPYPARVDAVSVDQLRALVPRRVLPRPAGAPDLSDEVLAYLNAHPEIHVPGIAPAPATRPAATTPNHP